MFENFPYTNFHDLNLDWIIQKIMESYSPDNPPPVGLVLSVNGETGAVVLYREQNVQLPALEETSWNFYRLTDDTAEGIKFTKGQPAERIDGSNRYQIYDTGNPPPSMNPPVSSVDGMTGAVKTWANSAYQTLQTPTAAPANIWDLRRELNNGDKVGIEFEYDSVNQVYKAFLKYTPSGGVPARVELLSSANIPESGVVSVNNKTGIVNIYATDIPLTSDSQESVKQTLDSIIASLSGKYTMPVNGIPASDLAPGVIPDVSGFQTKPATLGTAGQVLGLSSQLQPVWINQPSTSGLQPAPVQPGSSGQVLGLDSNLNPVWVNQSGGGGGSTPQIVNIESLLNSNFTPSTTSTTRNFIVINGKQVDIYLSVTNSSPLAANSNSVVFTFDTNVYEFLSLATASLYTGSAGAGLTTYANAYPVEMRLTTNSNNVSFFNRSNVAIPAGYTYYGHLTVYLA